MTASVDTADEMKLVAEGKCFPKREKAMPFTVCHGVTHEISKTVGAFWYNHEEGKDKNYIAGESKDYMQPAEFVIDCTLKKVILSAYSDGGLGRIDAGDLVGWLSGIQNRRDEFPHVWSW